jgi:flavodoxin
LGRALIIYDTATGNTRIIAEKIKKRLEDLGMSVELFRDKIFKAFTSVGQYQVIALGAPNHGNRPAFTLTRKLKPLLMMDLKGKKLITFASSGGPGHHQVCQKIESFIKPTGITPMTAIGCVGKPPEDFDIAIDAALQERMFLP